VPLCRAFVEVNGDPVMATGRSKDELWAAVQKELDGPDGQEGSSARQAQCERAQEAVQEYSKGGEHQGLLNRSVFIESEYTPLALTCIQI